MIGSAMEWHGAVQRKVIRRGTKSEHEALVLVTSQGEFKLRRVGGNPFHDETLDQLEGHSIRCTGELDGNEIFMSGWEVVD